MHALALWCQQFQRRADQRQAYRHPASRPPPAPQHPPHRRGHSPDCPAPTAPRPAPRHSAARAPRLCRRQARSPPLHLSPMRLRPACRPSPSRRGFVLQIQHDPLRDLRADTLGRLDRVPVAQRNRAADPVRRPSVPRIASDALAPTPCTDISKRCHSFSTKRRESRTAASGLRAPPDRYKAPTASPDTRQGRQRPVRAIDQIADTAHVDQHVIRCAIVDPSCNLANHALALATAAASALAAAMMRMTNRDRQRIGGIRARQSRHRAVACCTICTTCALSAWPTPTTVFFTVLGAYSPTLSPACAGTSIAMPRA